MQVTHDNTTQVTANFKTNEFYSKSFNAPKLHYLNDNLPLLAQIVRDFFNVPVTINSSFRTPEHNLAIGGATNSQHTKGNAIDITFAHKDKLKLIENFNAEVRKGGSLLKKLRSNGLTGLGLYNSFIHLDCRPDGGKHRDEFGSYAFWDYAKKKAVKARS